jgi:Predicted transcriptional regulators
METVIKKLQEIKPYDNNPRFNDAAVRGVIYSIKKFGFNQPIIIDKKGIIVAGHTRYLALKQMKVKEVECLVLDLPEKKLKKYRLADNRVREYSETDWELLKEELRELSEGLEEIFPDMDEILKDNNLAINDESLAKADRKLRQNIENRNADAVDYRKVECPNCHKILTIKSK